MERTEDGYLVEWSGLAQLHVGETLDFRADSHADPRAIEKLRRGPAVAVARYLRRTGLGFHAAAVARSGRGLLFSGDSGIGKSTAAALMTTQGWELLADDVAVVGLPGLLIEPTESDHWLDARSLELLGFAVEGCMGKTPIPSKSRASAPVQLTAFVELATGSEWDIQRLCGGAAWLALAKARALPAIDEPSRLQEDFEVLARIHSQVSVYRLVRPLNPSTQRLSALLTAIPELQ